jgi:hypothetical protein
MPCSSPACASPPDSPLNACSRCRTAAYCGSACQRAHWALHKSACREPPPPSFITLLARAQAPVDVPACLSAAPLPALPPLVVLAPSPGAGRGLFAASDIPALTEVFTDAAALWWPLEPCDEVGASIVGCGVARPGLSPAAVAGVLLNLAPWAAPSAASAAAAPRAPPSSMGELFTAACSLNALGLCVDEGPPRRMLPCIAPVAAMLNHSCSPNCSYEGVLVGGSPAVRIFSEVPIAAGEELTIAYVLRSLPREERRERLRDGYGIAECRCARCEEPYEGAWVARCGSCGAPNALARGGGAAAPVPCASCGAGDGGGGTRPAAREAWLAAAARLPPAALLGLAPASGAGAAAPLAPPLLHEDDQGVFSLLYGGLGALWGGRGAAAHAHSVEVVTRVCGSGALARAGRGAGFAGDALLFAGHLCTLAAVEGGGSGAAAAREAAARFYARAGAALAGVYGAADARVEMAARFLRAPAASRAELEAAERARLQRTVNWCARYPQLKQETLVRWCACPLPEPKSRAEMVPMLEALKALRDITRGARRVAGLPVGEA